MNAGIAPRVSLCYTNRVMTIEEIVQSEAVHTLVNDYRGMCFWNLAEDFLPRTREQLLMTLDYLERYGDLAAYRRAGRIRKWL